MSTLSPDRWLAVSPYLDRALGMREEERSAWLAALRERDAPLATDLQALLEEHDALARSGFLEHSPVFAPGEPGREGQSLGAYTLVSSIGQGGMGTVWLARRNDGRFERRVAIKFPSVDIAGPMGQERFRREGRLLGRLSHPHIAELLDAGITPADRPYLVLEYVDGETIDRFCDRLRLDVTSRVRLFLDVLAAVAHAHANLIVHRDLKPANVMVTAGGQVKLLDFGIAKLLEGDGQSAPAADVTREGSRSVMTPEYAAPEQLTGGPVTIATDVYALGVLFYLLLSGRHPAGPGPHSAAELMKAILEREPPRPSEAVRAGHAGPDGAAAVAANRAVMPEKLRHLLRGDLDTIVLKALKKDPHERYATVTSLAEDLRRHLRHEAISARPDTVVYRAEKFVRRNPLAVSLAVIALAASIAGVVGTLLQTRAARMQRDFAFRQLSRAEAINDLNSFLLSDAAPSGKPFTVNDLLGRAERILARQRGADAERVDLLVAIGRQHDMMDEDETALRLLDEAYRLSRNLPDRSTRARAACGLGSALSRGDESVRAEPLIQEGLGELPDDPQFALDRIFCLQRGSFVSRNLGKAQEGIGRVLAAQAALRGSPFQSRVLDLRIRMDLAEAYREAGQGRDACLIFEQAAADLTALGRDDTQTAGTLFNNWAVALEQMGRSLEAERIFRRAIEISRSHEGEETVSPMLLVNYAAVLASLDRLGEAADYGERATARARQSGDQTVVNMSLLHRETIYRKQANLDRAEEMLAEVEPGLRKVLPAGHIAFAAVEAKRSLIALARGDAITALDFANRAMALFEASVKAGGAGANNLPGQLLRRAEVLLALDRAGEAAADATKGAELLQQAVAPGSHSSLLGHAYLVLGQALDAQGQREEALTSLRSALEHLEASVGSEHSQTLKAREAIARLAGAR